MDDGSHDIIARYQKLAAEYSKMRAQTTVLKKAVADEQTKGNEIKEAVKEKDQAIRKLEQEVECLTFRNHQLTKRVSVLQDDMEAASERLKRTKNKSSGQISTSCENQGVLNAELLSRIEENEKLHQQVYSLEMEHKKIVADLSSQVDSLQSEIARQHSQMSEKISKLETTIDKLSQERARTEVLIKNYEKEIKDLKLKDETCNEELQFLRQDLGSKLRDTSGILEEKVFFNDTRCKFFNDLNVPVLLRKQQNQLTSLIVELRGFVADLVRRLSDLHTYTEQKIRSIEPDSDINGPMKRFGSFLHGNAQYLKGIENAFSDFTMRIQKDSSAWLETFSLKGMSSALSKYVLYLDKLLPYLILSIQAEDCIKGTTPRLKDIYKKLNTVSKSLILAFSKLDRYIQLLVEIGLPNKNVYFVNRSLLIKRIILCLDSLQALFEEARKVFSAKVVIEQQLPTATDTTKNTDDCILSSLVSVVASLKKITIPIQENLDVLVCEIPYRPRGLPGQNKFSVNPCIAAFRERGLKYMTLTHMEEPSSIPYELAMRNNETLSSYADSQGSLIQQLETCKNKLSQLELDKEHWMLECQLLKTRQLKNSHSSAEDDADTIADDQSFQIFVKSSVNNLVAQIQFADSKVLAFQTECEFLHQKLRLVEQKKESLEKQMAEANDIISRTKEEHKMMMKTYEDQLSMMSEHLATMNEVLTTQKDEIDALKQVGSQKGLKKIKGK